MRKFYAFGKLSWFQIAKYWTSNLSIWSHWFRLESHQNKKEHTFSRSHLGTFRHVYLFDGRKDAEKWTKKMPRKVLQKRIEKLFFIFPFEEFELSLFIVTISAFLYFSHFSTFTHFHERKKEKTSVAKKKFLSLSQNMKKLFFRTKCFLWRNTCVECVKLYSNYTSLFFLTNSTAFCLECSLAENSHSRRKYNSTAGLLFYQIQIFCF